MLGGALLAAYQNWNVIKPQLEQLWHDIGGTISYVVDTAKAAVDRFSTGAKNTMTDAVEFIAKKARAAKDLLNEAIDSVNEAGNSFGQNFSVQGVASAIAGARADGGPVSGGKTYLVGERGPELFTPSRSGNIIPNGAPVGGNVTVNVNM